LARKFLGDESVSGDAAAVEALNLMDLAGFKALGVSKNLNGMCPRFLLRTD
jgi:hypothetical protein